MFDDDAEKVCGGSLPGASFWEEDTLDLFRRLAELVPNNKDRLYGRVGDRWRPGEYHRGDDRHEDEALQIGKDNTMENEEVRFHLKGLIHYLERDEAERMEDRDLDERTAPKESGDMLSPTEVSSLLNLAIATSSEPSKPATNRPGSASQADNKRKRESDKPDSPRRLRNWTARNATHQEESDDATTDQPEDDPSSASSNESSNTEYTIQPSERKAHKHAEKKALARIQKCWPLAHDEKIPKSPFHILPQHSFHPRTYPLVRPFREYFDLLILVRRLAIATAGCKSEARKALVHAFKDEYEFDEDLSKTSIEKLTRKFENAKMRRERRSGREALRIPRRTNSRVGTTVQTVSTRSSVPPTHARRIPTSSSQETNPHHTSTTLNTLHTTLRTLRTQNATLLTTLTHHPTPTLPGLPTPRAVFKHNLAHTQLNRAELELHRARLQRSHAIPGRRMRDSEAAVVEAEIKVERVKGVVLGMEAERA